MFKSFKYTFGCLEITVFITGMIVMILEMVGSRVLAPFFGNSIFVWTSIIGIILASLSFGYYYGGRLADRKPNYQLFGKIILLAGFSIAFLTLFKSPILIFASFFGIKLGSIIGSILIFAWPSLLLGLVSPFAVKLKINELNTSGSTVGYLYALSTMGSIVGTFLAGFILISFLENTMILYLIAVILIAVANFVGKFRLKFIVVVLILLFIFIGIFVLQQKVFASKDYLLEKDSNYNHIRVADYIEKKSKKRTRVLLMGTMAHSIKYLDSDELASGYTKYYRLDKFFNNDIKNALMIGGGAYTVPRDILKRFPQSTIDVIEIDPEVTRAAYRFFGLQQDKRLNIIHKDGRIYLNQNQKKYDAIYIDAFGSYFNIPFQLTTIESAQRVYEALNDKGVVLINIIGALSGNQSDLAQAEYKIYSTIFPKVYLFGVNFLEDSDPNKLQNVMLIAAKSQEKLTIDDLKNLAGHNQEFKSYLETYYQPDYDLENVRMLTDEFAPVENYALKYL